jgi:hypothetical protein
MLNCVTNDLLEHNYSPYGTSPPFPCPTTLGDPMTSRANSSQVNLSFVFKSESRLLNKTQSLLCYRVLRVVRHPWCRGEVLLQPADLPRGRHHLWQASGRHTVQASGALPIAVSSSVFQHSSPTVGSGLLATADAMGNSTWRVGIITLCNASVEDIVSTYFLATHGKTNLCKFNPNIDDLLIFMKTRFLKYTWLICILTH